MHTRRLTLALGILVGAAIVGCQTPPPDRGAGATPIGPLPPESARQAGLSAEALQQAATLNAAKCARCHKLYDPRAYSESEWHRWMVKMSKKAHLQSEQEELLTRYFDAIRSASKPAEQP